MARTRTNSRLGAAPSRQGRHRSKRAHAPAEAVFLLPPNPGEVFLSGAEWVAVAEALHLTTREMLVAALVVEGRTRAGIARKLKGSPETVRVHIDNLFAKLHVKDRVSLVVRIARVRDALRSKPP